MEARANTRGGGVALDSNGRLQIKFKFTHSSPTSGGYKHHTTCHKARPMQNEEQYQNMLNRSISFKVLF